MNYIKATFKISPDNQDLRDILVAMLGELGFESFVENENAVDAFIPSGNYSHEILAGLEFNQLFSFEVETVEIPDQNWNEVWEKNYFKPLIVTGKCVVRAPFHTDYPKAEYEIIIEPNMAFGTGNHETTTMMMEYLLESDVKGKTVLDMGCGTGILSILASQCGASTITAIDFDKWSFEGTIENSKLNDIQNIIPIHGDASSIPNIKFDLILANIQRNVILADMPFYIKALKPEGAIIVSGFYHDDLIDIEKRAKELGLVIINSKTTNNWCSACFAFLECRNKNC
jgi:ribosomal protein L11 methyltransferase